MYPTQYQKLEKDRQALVEGVLEQMEKGSLFWKQPWNPEALAPYNPASGTIYQGGNRLRLTIAVMQKHYTDPRWMTFNQIRDKGYHLKKGSKGIALEKWIFDKEVTVEENGVKRRERVELDHPIVNRFVVFNGSQVAELPQYQAAMRQSGIADRLKESAECPVHEDAQSEAYYDPGKDEIHVPIREVFHSEEGFAATLAHEMIHATGHPDRLNRTFGTWGLGVPDENYCREELRAEIGSMFLMSDLGINQDSSIETDLKQRGAYIQGFYSLLKKDPNELFRAAKDASAAADRIKERYLQRYPNPQIQPLLKGKTKELRL